MLEGAEARIAVSLREIRAGLPLAHDGDPGAREAYARAQRPHSRSSPRRRWSGALLASVLVGLGASGVAVAAVVSHAGSDPVHDFFWGVPQKGPHGGRLAVQPSEEPHVLVATVTLPDAQHASVYVSAAHEPAVCLLVQNTLGDGSVGQGTCGDGPQDNSAAVWPMSGVLVGAVPDTTISRVRVTLGGQNLELAVVDRYFAFAPPDNASASTLVGQGQIVGYDSSGNRIGTWAFSLPYSGRS